MDFSGILLGNPAFTSLNDLKCVVKCRESEIDLLHTRFFSYSVPDSLPLGSALFACSPQDSGGCPLLCVGFDPQPQALLPR